MKKEKIFKVCIILILILILILCFFYFIKNLKPNNINAYEQKKTPKWEQSKYDLREDIPIDIEYQIKDTWKSCWAYATLDSIETNLLLHKQGNYDFSESHIEYMTSTLMGGERELNSGGGFLDVLKYIGRRCGPVLESEIPNKLYNEEDFEQLKNAKQIVKLIHTKNFQGEEKNIREKIKKHIVENGAICVNMYYEPPKKEEKDNLYYDSETYGYCNLNMTEANHAASIIGWDDNFKKENFPEENRPNTDGAYLINSYWKYSNIIYISYEDFFIKNINATGVINCTLMEE